MRPAVTQGYLLRHGSFSGGDRWYRLLTRDLGLAQVTAQRRLVQDYPHLGSPVLLDCHTLIVVPRRRSGGFRLVDGALAARHLWLAGDLERLAAAGVVAETLERLAPLEDPQPALFDLLESFLGALELGGTPWVLRDWALATLLRVAGFGPTLETCRNCSEPLRRDSRFVSGEGGVFHAGCAPDGMGLTVARGTLRFLSRLAGLGAGEAARLKGDRTVRRESGALLEAYIAAVCQEHSRAWAFTHKTEEAGRGR